MTTATPATTGNSASDLAQAGDKEWIGPLDREDPEIYERAGLPRQQSAVAEATSHLDEESFFKMITRTIAALHEWLAGPPASAQNRVRHDIAEHRNWPVFGPIGGA